MISGIGELELMLIAVVTLLVIGPERLPETLRTLGLWIGRLSRSFSSVKAEIEKEIGMDEVRQQLHNEAVMAEMQRIESEVKAATQLDGSKTDDAPTPHESDSNETLQAPPPDIQPPPPSEADVEAAYARRQHIKTQAEEGTDP